MCSPRGTTASALHSLLPARESWCIFYSSCVRRTIRCLHPQELCAQHADLLLHKRRLPLYRLCTFNALRHCCRVGVLRTDLATCISEFYLQRLLPTPRLLLHDRVNLSILHEGVQTAR